eukprot:1536134-Pyramimonas_sp.AAC.1
MVQTRFLYDIEGITIDASTLKCIHAREGELLSKLVWRRNKPEVSWSVFGRRMLDVGGGGGGILQKMGKPSLVQLTLYKQWMWAKDVALSCFPVELDASPDFAQNEPSVTGGSQELG